MGTIKKIIWAGMIGLLVQLAIAQDGTDLKDQKSHNLIGVYQLKKAESIQFSNTVTSVPNYFMEIFLDRNPCPEILKIAATPKTPNEKTLAFKKSSLILSSYDSMKELESMDVNSAPQTGTGVIIKYTYDKFTRDGICENSATSQNDVWNVSIRCHKPKSQWQSQLQDDGSLEFLILSKISDLYVYMHENVIRTKLHYNSASFKFRTEKNNNFSLFSSFRMGGLGESSWHNPGGALTIKSHCKYKKIKL